MRRLGEGGCVCRVVRIARLAELEEDIAAQVRSGALSPDVIRERLGFFDFHPPQGLPRAVSVIVVAIPLPQSRLVFHWQGNSVQVAVLPAYLPVLNGPDLAKLVPVNQYSAQAAKDVTLAPVNPVFGVGAPAYNLVANYLTPVLLGQISAGDAVSQFKAQLLSAAE
jgi:hypothetical protein